MENKLTFGVDFTPHTVKDLKNLLKIINEEEIKNNNMFIDIILENCNVSNKEMAKNLINSLRSYKLVKKNGYDLTKIGSVLISSEKIYVDFAKHIIENLDGSKYLRAIELIKKDGIICTRNEQIIRKINIEYNTNYKTTTKYISSLKQWLIKGGVIDKRLNIQYEFLHNIIGNGVSKDNECYFDISSNLNFQQVCFLKELVYLSSEENQKYIKAQEIARCCEKQFRININFKNISKIINPLYNQGLIEIADGSKKNSAKNVRLSDKIINNKVYLNLIREIEYFCEPKYSFKEAYDIIINKKVKSDGIALECIGLYIAKILGLTNIKYRECSEVTGHCEVDISGEDRNFTYQRWHIQCKDNKSVTNDRIAREVGIAQISKVNNILFITTGKFSDYATLYCEKVMKETNVNIYYIETKELKEIRDNPEKLIEIIREQSDRISRLRNRTTMLV